MRVLLINWARPTDGAALGGGVNGYLQSLALSLIDLGHEVGWLYSGQTYTHASAPSSLGPCEIRRRESWRDIAVFEVINSPVISPGVFQGFDPATETSSPVLEAEFSRFLALLRPDIVHFHNLEGFSAGCLVRASEPDPHGRRPGVLFSLHNYHTVCPQVYLLQRGRVPCRDFQGGHACVACVGQIDGARERLRRASEYSSVYSYPLPLAPPPPVGVTWRDAIRGSVLPPAPPSPPAPLPGDPVRSEQDASIAPPAGVLPASPPPADPAELAPLDNDILPEPAYAGTPHAFGVRRGAVIQSLNRCDRVLAVSRFVQDKFQSLGVSTDVLGLMPIGTLMTLLYDSQPELHAAPPGFDTGRAVRLCFMGYHNFAKGLHMLVDSLERMSTAALAKVDLLVNAKEVEPMVPRLSALRPRLAALTVHHGYRYELFPRAVFGRDVGLVPSVWWDNGPQTVMEFLACRLPVIGAAVGGIPDLVKDGVNGRLHRGNDRDDLARVLTDLVEHPQQIEGFRQRITPPQSMKAHAEEMNRLYASVRDRIEARA